MTFENSATDTQLMRRISTQDQSALSDLYERYGAMVYGMAYRVLQNPVLSEEATQDTFLKVWNQSYRWQSDKGALSTWLMTIARYTAIDRLRKERREVPSGALDIDAMLDLIGQYADDRNQIDELRLYMSQLPPEQLEVIQLAFYNGFSHNEIAEKLKIPLGTIKSRARMGLQKLRAMWLKASDSDES